MKVYFFKLLFFLFFILDKTNKKAYKLLFPKFLSYLGVKISLVDTNKTWISPKTFFDSSRYDLIEIGKGVTISFNVTLLVHDYSIVHAARAISGGVKSIIYQPIKIGDNSFIGANVTILPGTIIENNVIIGAGSVVKGICLQNGIYAGNPARRIGTIESLCNKYSLLIY